MKERNERMFYMVSYETKYMWVYEEVHYSFDVNTEYGMRMANPLESEEDLLPSIRQLITSIKPTLQAARSQSAVLEMVTHLEETDDNFHR